MPSDTEVPVPNAQTGQMNELIGNEDPFERVNGWTNEKTQDLINDATNLIQGLDKRAYRAFLCTIDITARDRLVQQGYSIPDPELICSNWCVTKAFDWYMKAFAYSIDPMYLFFDRGEEYMSRIETPWLKNRTPPGRPKSQLWWDMIANIVPVDMATTPPIQLADMVAWSRSRILSERERPLQHLIRVLNSIMPTTVLQLDEAKMRHAHFNV